jgi:hypothetical protein
MEKFLVIAQVSKTLAFCFANPDQVISMMCIVLALDKYSDFCIVQSTLHKEWVCKYASALKSDTRYTPSDVFENFPFPQTLSGDIRENLDKIGRQYTTLRQEIMQLLNIGLTKLYNLFHDPECNIENMESLRKKNEFKQVPTGINIESVINKIITLRLLHRQMDEQVLNAYDWDVILLEHGFYEINYLPENDRVRYTISEEARMEILRRLLALNHEIHNTEVEAGLWENPRKFATKKGQIKNDGDQENLNL